MSVVLASPVIALLLALLIAFVASRLARLFSTRVASRRIGRLVGLGSFAVLVVGLPWWLSQPTVYIDMPPAKGERLLCDVGLPPGTTEDFCYRFSFIGVTVLADFKMKEADFLRWMDSQGWKAKRFQTNGKDPFASLDLPDGRRDYEDVSVTPVRLQQASVETIPRQGYVFSTADPDHPDNTKKIVYDLEAGRAYYQHTTY
jgi:hypothetical protein